MFALFLLMQRIASIYKYFIRNSASAFTICQRDRLTCNCKNNVKVGKTKFPKVRLQSQNKITQKNYNHKICNLKMFYTRFFYTFEAPNGPVVHHV